ncbi:MAG: hypothetical protein ACYDH3_07940 [Candidatus Aminicenantales bacterium]
MKIAKSWLWILALGSLWGLAEVAGEGLWAKDIPFSSVILSAFAFFLMGIGRALLNKPGTSTAMGATAALFKLVNAAPYFCHLLGIVMLALAFDAAATLWMKNEKKAGWKRALSGFVGAFSGSAIFALVITYIVRYRPWVMGGLPKVLNHIFVSGTMTAVAAAVLVYLGFGLGLSGNTISDRQPRWAFAGALALLVVLWTLGRVI